MQTFKCPSCGADIKFRTSIAPYAVCAYCRTMVVRQDDGIKNLGIMAELPDDMSPFQIGSEGYYKGVHFGIVGRMRIGWAEGSWNEWFIVSDDMKKGWLAEAQGFYAPCFETTERLDAAHKHSVDALGARIKSGAGMGSVMSKPLALTQAEYTIVDVKQAECIACQGELPFRAPAGRRTTSIDLVHGDGLFASIEFSDEGSRVFEGSYVEWEALRVSNYRHFEGW